MAKKNDAFVDETQNDNLDEQFGDADTAAEISWDGLADASRPIDPGAYVVEIRQVKDGTSKKGDPMVTVFFRIVDEGPFHGRTDLVSYFMKGRPESATIFARMCGHVGVDIRNDRVRKEELVGRFLRVTVKNRVNDQDGSVRSEIDRFYRYEG